MFFLTDNTTAFLCIPANISLSMVIISCDLEPIISGTSSAKRHIKVLPGRKQLQKVVQTTAATVMVTWDSCCRVLETMPITKEPFLPSLPWKSPSL